VLVPIFRSDDERARVMEVASRIAGDLRAAGVRAKVDDRESVRPGFKFNEWERKGVPIRIELGPRDLDREEATLLRRDTMEKWAEGLGALAARVTGLLEEIQASLLAQAAASTEANTIHPASYEEMRAFLDASGGFAIAPWCGRPECETRVKADTKATIRLLPLDPASGGGACIVCGEPAVDEATWARAY
jgi:prolyl-tRNA synthetase